LLQLELWVFRLIILSLKSIKNILTTGQDKVPVEEAIKSEEDIEAFGYTRGAGYYGGKKNDK